MVSLKLLYAARPMGTYAVPISMLLPSDLTDGFTVLDPALCRMRGKGMENWHRLVSKCDRIVALTSMNIVTAGVQDELNHAHSLGLEILTPWLTQRPRVLSIEETVSYNKFGTTICDPNYARGFCVWDDHPNCPSLLPWRELTIATASN